MDKSEINSLPAGRTLDALVAEHLMGWERTNDNLLQPPLGDQIRGHLYHERVHFEDEWDENGIPIWLPPYSTSQSDTWDLILKLRLSGLITIHCWHNGMFQIQQNNLMSIAESFPLAVSRFSLFFTKLYTGD